METVRSVATRGKGEGGINKKAKHIEFPMWCNCV
jgi:hypothetical protein